MRRIAILFADRDSIYKELLGCEVYDVDRDALTFPGGMPVVAHPPCRLWSCLSHFSTAPVEEKGLATWAIRVCQREGGVVEHPATSRLWKEAGMPRLGERDKFGGWLLPVLQWWWGHRAEKATKLYLVGIGPKDLPPIPFRIGEPTMYCNRPRSKAGLNLDIPKRERSATPHAFAEWLCEVARRTKIRRSG